MSHVVMPKKLAHALMESSMHHYDAGGMIPEETVQHFAGGGMANWFGAGNGFVAEGPQLSSQEFRPQIQQQYGQQQDVYNQQQALAQALLSQSQGQGPNPAQSMLNQQTGNNVSNQAALMAGQRGASQNPGLLARQAAQQGASTQQQAVGQGATMQAQQQLAAQQALQQQQAQMANQALQSQSILQGANASQNASNMSAQGINAQVAGQNAQANQAITGGLLQGLGSMLSLHKGGQVPGYAVGGQVNDQMGIENFLSPSIPNLGLQVAPQLQEGIASIGNAGGGIKKMFGGSGGGSGAGSMDGMSMAGGAGDAGGLTGGEGIGMLALAAKGGKIGGKPLYKGNDPRNDTVDAKVSPGEIVLPNSVTQGPNVEKKAVEFLRHLRANKKGYGKVIDARSNKKACGGYV